MVPTNREPHTVADRVKFFLRNLVQLGATE